MFVQFYKKFYFYEALPTPQAPNFTLGSYQYS